MKSRLLETPTMLLSSGDKESHAGVFIHPDEVWDYAVAVHEALKYIPHWPGNARARETLCQFRNLCAAAIKGMNPAEELDDRNPRRKP